MMRFRLVNAAIIKLLGDSAAGQYRVVGYKGQGKAAKEVKDSDRVVQSYFSTGNFSTSSGRPHGATQHAMVFTIGLSVSAAARINLSVINDPNANAGQVTAALTELQEAAYRADLLMDELADIVYQVLMHGPNCDLGFPVGTITNRWIDQIQKDPPAPSGELVVLTGTVQFSCATSEAVTGVVLVPAEDVPVVGVALDGTVLELTVRWAYLTDEDGNRFTDDNGNPLTVPI